VQKTIEVSTSSLCPEVFNIYQRKFLKS
jgi:hypothetical protein